MNIELTFLYVFLLVILSGICSGLNIALMSLETGDLRRKKKLGHRGAARVLPYRTNSHLTLAAILLVNVAVVSATSLVLESRYNGLIAALASTLLIVIVGEIFPQALFARQALKFCSWLTPAMRTMIIVTYPISKPLQLLLDKLFSQKEGPLHSRRELGIIFSEHLGNNTSELDEDEVEIMRGALFLSEKRVRDIMTHIKHVYWVTPETLIDADKIDEIKELGRSRLPVFNQELTECYGVLHIKDLIDIDFDNNPIRVSELPLYKTTLVGSMTALDTMFRKFIVAKSHLIPIERDDHIVGIVTIEDLLEEILGHEIEDESDHARVRIA